MLSLSEFFSFVGMGPFHRRRSTGDRMWGFYARQRSRTRLMLRGSFEELLYPFDDPPARFTCRDVPPILCATLPHLTSRHDALFAEREPIVRSQPRQPSADHIRRLFACSMSGHDLFRMIVATMRVLRCRGIDVVGRWRRERAGTGSTPGWTPW